MSAGNSDQKVYAYIGFSSLTNQMSPVAGPENPNVMVQSTNVEWVR